MSQIHGSIVKRSKTESPYYQIHTPPEVVAELNQRFWADQRDRQYFTIVYGLIETRSGRVTLTQAGHPFPVRLECATGKATRVGNGGFPVAMFKSAEYDAVNMTLEKGDRLIVYSDGVTDCQNRDGEPFSTERLVSLIERAAYYELEDVVGEISRVIHDWNGSADFEDDISLMILERTSDDHF